MKGRKLLALCLALVLAVGMWVPAAAQTYPDVEEDFWAYSYIEDMTERGLFTGYNDGSFGPEDVITESTGLALCSRLLVARKSDTWNAIVAAREEETAAIVPDSPAESWFRSDAAVALELGIVSQGELKALVKKGLSTPMTKADFAMYLLRGLGLEEFVRMQNGEDISLDFNDADQIAEKYLPYVYLLDKFGVLTGDLVGNFNPDQEITRAICATMLSRALKNIAEGRRVAVELPGYSDYAWVSGIIVGVDSDGGDRVLTLEDPLTDKQTDVTLPSQVREHIYRYNTPSGWTALQPGAYARVCYDEGGKTPVAVRVIPKVSFAGVAGACGAANGERVTVDGEEYTVNRFTWVSAGGKVGDREIIDPDSGYKEATAWVDFYGNVLWLDLQGGTRCGEGILTALTDDQLTITSYSGVPTAYDRTVELTSTLDGLKAALRDVMVGSRVTFRVSDADLSHLVSVDVDGDGTYIQGILRSKDTISTYPKISVQLTGATENKRYELEEDCVITYDEEPITFKELPLSFITARVEGGSITWLSAWQGYEDVRGTLSSITYGDPTVLAIAKADGTVTDLSIPTALLNDITVTSEGKRSDITKLRTGDTVVVTLLYHEVDQIDFTAKAADVTGTLDSVTFNSDGSAVLTLNFTAGGSGTYTVSSSATVMRNGVAVAITDLKVGNTLSLVTDGEGKALSVEITGTAAQKDWLEGSVYLRNDSARTVVLLTKADGENSLKTVHINSGVPILDVNTGTTLRSITSLEPGDILQVWGSYTADGIFEAVSVIRR